MKTIAALLLSEYNRVETTNQKLYLLSRDPYVLCNVSKQQAVLRFSVFVVVTII